MVTIGSLFTGVAGLDMAVQDVFGGTHAWFSEIDPAASKVLAYRFPGVRNLGDITQIDWAAVEPVDVLCGGFPCQDVSAAGKRAGIKDGTRSGLWAVFAEAIDALRPQYVVIENVRGLLSAAAHRTVEDDAGDYLEPGPAVVGDGAGRPVLRAAGAVLGDLADLGYDAQWATVAAADVGAPHRRERVFIVASSGHPQNCSGRFEYGNASQAWGTRSLRWSGEDCAEVQSHIDLFPTPNAQDGNGGGRYSSPGHQSTLPGEVRLLPTPRSSDCFGAGQHGNGGMDLRTTVALFRTPNASDAQGQNGRPSRASHQPSVGDQVVMLCTPSASDGFGGKTSRSGDRIDEPLLGGQAREMAAAWGKHEPAIRRWEQVTGQPAPAPTEPNKNGNPRLSAAFSEWLMGWPAGWVTDPAIGISRNDRLRCVGNGVVTLQAVAAIRYLLAVTA